MHAPSRVQCSQSLSVVVVGRSRSVESATTSQSITNRRANTRHRRRRHRASTNGERHLTARRRRRLPTVAPRHLANSGGGGASEANCPRRDALRNSRYPGGAVARRHDNAQTAPLGLRVVAAASAQPAPSRHVGDFDRIYVVTVEIASTDQT